MIFQSLVSLYDRLYAAAEVPEYGFSDEDIGFVVTLDRQGNVVGQPEDLRVRVKAHVFEYKTSRVPYTNQVNVRSRAAAKTPNFMVDKAHYIFGMSGKAQKKTHHKSFSDLVQKVCGGSRDDGVLAVRAFLEKWDPAQSPSLENWEEMCGTHGKWVGLRLKGERRFIHERPAVKKLWTEFTTQEDYPKGISFLDGQQGELQTQYAQFKFGSGASLVSFNKRAFESYGKSKGENAPISVDGEFKSSTALKYLLRKRSQRLRIGDATTVFWTERASSVETFMGKILDPSLQDEDDAVPVRKFLEAVRKGTLPSGVDGEARFYILGLAENKGRLALRFWYVCTVQEFIGRLRDHFANLEMDYRTDKDISFPGIWHLLKETARESKGISPVLGGALMRSILTGVDYPANLYQGVMGRIRADQAKKYPKSGNPIPNVTHLRAGILKAVLQRNYGKEVPMSLDPKRRESAYLLGRLFAVLEKAQLDALGKVNATIKDRFFGAASATPASVFPRLLRLSQHHIEKAEYGHMSERRISEIMEHVNAFPSHMNLQDQGLFAIAYYQQKNELWRKKDADTEQGEET